MVNRVHRLVVTLALTGLAGGVLAQTGTGAPGTDSSPPGGPHPHAWQGGDEGDHGDRGKWGHDGEDGHRWHGHHHHHHHHHGRWGGGWHGRGGWHDHGGWQDHGRGPGPMMWFRGLDLTSAQKDQIHSILSNARQEWMKKRQNGGTDMAALGNPGDPGYGAAVQAAKKRAADRIQEGSDLQLKLYNVLTPQQKSELTKRFADRKAQMAKWKADHAKDQNGGPGRQ